MDTLLIPMIAIWIILGLVVTLLLQNLFRRPAPFGVTVDYIIGVAAALIVGLLDYFVIIPAFGLEVPLWRALGSAAEAPFGSWLILLVLRQLKRTPPAE